VSIGVIGKEMAWHTVHSSIGGFDSDSRIEAGRGESMVENQISRRATGTFSRVRYFPGWDSLT